MNLPSIVMSAPSGVDLMTTVDGSPAGLGAAGEPELKEPVAGVAAEPLGVPGAMLRASAGAAASVVELPAVGLAADAAGAVADAAGCEPTDLTANLAESRVTSPLM